MTRCLALPGALMLVMAVAVSMASSAAAAVVTTTFKFSGAEQKLTLPAGVGSVTITAVGAPGGSPQKGAKGRDGASVSATVPVPAGAGTLYVEVGGAGGTRSGGYNGGGPSAGGGGGGGASDVRTCSTASCSSLSLQDTRLLVAGGGGGGGATCTAASGGIGGDTSVRGGGAGGKGGDSCGATASGLGGGFGGTNGGTGGAGSALRPYPGSTGQLGLGGAATSTFDSGDLGGGGGGGYWGGGGGGDAASSGGGGGGGAGSSYWAAASSATSMAEDTTGTPSVKITYLTPATVSVSCNAARLVVGANTTCKATVSDKTSPPSTPNGTVRFSSDNSGTFSGSGTCTLAGTGTTGTTTCAATYTPTAVGSGTHTVTATYSGDSTHGTASAVTTVSVPPARVTVSVAADFSGDGKWTITAQALDGSGALLSSYRDAVPTWSDTAGRLGTQRPAGFSAGTSTTVGVTLAAVRGDAISVTTNGIIGTSTAFNVIGPAASVKVTLSPVSLTADGVSTSNVIATVTDAAGSGVAGDRLTLASAATGGPSFGSVTDNGDGTYTATATASPKAGSFTITATDTSVTGVAGSAVLTQKPGPAATVTVTFSPGTITADGNSHSIATATVSDKSGNPVAGEQIAFSGSGVGGPTVGATTDTGNGAYTATVTASTTAGSFSLTAVDSSAGGISGSALLTQRPGSVASLTVTVAPSPVTADGTSTSVATARALDAHGNPVPGGSVSFSSSGAGAPGVAATTDQGDGTYSAVVAASATAGTFAIKATDTSGSGVTGTANLVQQAGPAAALSVALSPATVPADGTSASQASVTATDAHGNRVAGEQISISAGGPGAPVAGSITDRGNGTYSAPITSSVTPGSVTITASDAAAGGISASALLTQTTPPAYQSGDMMTSGGSLVYPWLAQPANYTGLISPISTDQGQGVAITTAPTDPTVQSSMSAAYLGASYSYAGYTTANTQVDGQSTWYHVGMQLPSSGYVPTTGQWNWLVEWHNDDHTANYGPVSMALGIYTDWPVETGAVGQNPRLVLRLAGGQSSAPVYEDVNFPQSMVMDHWYNMSFHFVWSADPNVGVVEWYVDGNLIDSEHFATLFTNPDGTTSYNTFAVENYHYEAPWSSTVNYNQVAIGPTKASVGG